MKLSTAFLGALLMMSAAIAQHYNSGPVQVMSPWSRALPPVSANGAAYLTLRNHSDAPDKLISASSPIADNVEVHTHVMEVGMMAMRRAEFVEIKPAEYVTFEPGGNHFMLIGLKKPLSAGDRFPLTLRFEHAPAVPRRAVE